LSGASVLHVSKNPGGWPEYLAQAMDAARVESAADLARRAGISEPMVSRWLRGQNQPDIENLRKLSPVLGIPVLTLTVAAGHLSPLEAKIREMPAPVPQEIDVPTAIREDRNLIPEAREHLERQYGLLVRLEERTEDEPAIPLRRVSRKRSTPKRPT
jgi:transcriptional regulator with XRE-family HTH domain